MNMGKKGVFGKCVSAVEVHCIMFSLEEKTLNLIKVRKLKAFKKTF